MTVDQFKEKIRMIVKKVYVPKKEDTPVIDFQEFDTFPELRVVIIDLLTDNYGNFISSIDYVAPKPTTFRINLKNGQYFYLVWSERSWIAQVEGKKYYLLNLNEEERSIEAIARILRYSPPEGMEGEDNGDVEVETEEVETEETE
tara:strand:+ start:203 stop:637 length:435 start_codon:yes stop_codon:yes gene_type:complete